MPGACDSGLTVVRGSPAVRVVAFSALADRGADEPAVQRAVREALGQAVRVPAGFSGPAPLAAAACLQWVQRLPYRPDPAGSDDLVTEPCRTVRVGGDCEDLSILLVAMWAAAGVRGRVFWISQRAADQDHVTAEAWLGGRWRYGEATVRGARLGEDPYLAAARLQVRGHGSL